jgi:hypothetical protein
MSLFGTKKKDDTTAPTAASATNTKATKPPNKDTVKSSKKSAITSTQLHLQIAEIRDNLLILKNGGVRAILKTSSVNVHLKSEDEQNAVIYSYQNFLNTLEFPIQIVVRSKKLDLDNYLDDLGGIAKKQTHTLLKEQTVDYIDYIKRLIEYADIMQKEFYVVIPYDPPRAKKPTLIQKFMQRMSQKDSIMELRQRNREFETLYKGLMQRVNVTSSGLQNCGLKAEQLKTDGLVTLFYECYNPRTSRLQKFKKSSELAVDQDTSIHKEEKDEENEN